MEIIIAMNTKEMEKGWVFVVDEAFNKRKCGWVFEHGVIVTQSLKWINIPFEFHLLLSIVLSWFSFCLNTNYVGFII